MQILVDDQDFEQLAKHVWRLNKTGYASRCGVTKDTKSGQMTVLMHRFVMNAPRGSEIDHIDGNKLNNQKANLRFCTRSQNLKNAPRKATVASGYKGVYVCGKNWKVYFQHERKFVNCGVYSTREAAAHAYDFYVSALYPDFAHLNFPSDRWEKHRIDEFKCAMMEPKSGIAGVVRRGSGWCAKLWMNGKMRHIGQFKTPQEASAAREAAKANYRNNQLN